MGGDGGMDFTNITQIGFEQGSDNFSIMVEQLKLPTKRLILFQEKSGSIVTSFWEGDYTETLMVLYTASGTHVSSRARGITWGYALEKDGTVYDPATIIAIEFEFGSIFTVESITSFELNKARTEWGETLVLTVNNPSILLPPSKAATESFAMKEPMSGQSQTGMLDFNVSNI